MSDNKNVTNDVAENKAIGALAYILFFLPLVAAKDSEFGRFHANQGLLVTLLALIVYVVGLIIPWFGWFVLWPVGGIICGVFAIIGIINAVNEKTKELPLIGGIRIIK